MKKLQWWYQILNHQKKGPFSYQAEAWQDILSIECIKDWYPHYESIEVFCTEEQSQEQNTETLTDAPCNRAPRSRPFLKKRAIE